MHKDVRNVKKLGLGDIDRCICWSKDLKVKSL